MKPKSLLLVSFFIVLYIAPLIFAPSYISPTILTEQNMSKEFQVSEYGDESAQSITSFSETLADDVLFYPDAFFNTTFATEGSGTPTPTGTYILTHSIATGAFYTLDASSPYETTLGLKFGNIETLTESNFDSITVNLYGQTYSTDGAVTTHDLEIWNGTNWIDYGDIYDTGFGSSYGWTNFTFTDLSIFSFGIHELNIRAHCVDGSLLTVGIKYAEVVFSYMALADADHYAESFADVSDWTVSVGDTPTTDYDLISLKPAADGVFDKIYTNVPSMVNDLNYYYEYRAKANATSATFIQFYGYESDGASTASHLLDSYSVTTSWVTRKGIITHDGALESISCLFKSSVASNIQVDYLRISPATEMGWQHDGSTTEGVVGGNGGTISTDGDSLTCIDDGDGSVFDFYIDTTATPACLEPNYYQFIEIQFSSGNSNFRMDSIDQSDSVATITSYTVQGSTTLYRYNLDATENQQTKFIRLTSYGINLIVDYIKAYSIANYTVTPSTETDTYVYCDSGILYYHQGASGDNYIQLEHDPVISVSSTYNVWNITTGGYDGFYFKVYNVVDGWVYEVSNGVDTRGDIPNGVTDFYIIFHSDVTDSYIAAITFVDGHYWHEVGEATIYFIVQFDYWAFNMFMVFFGLILVIASGCYLAYSIKNNMSQDKFFYFLIAFFMGWGLFLGGMLI